MTEKTKSLIPIERIENLILLLRGQKVIKRLMKATFESKDPKEKSLLALIELEARKCRGFILGRLKVRN